MAQQTINLGTPPAGADGDTIRIAMSKVQANFNELYNGALAVSAFKNLLINGNFDVWQRGTSLASGAGIRFCADRWLTQSGGGATNNVFQQSTQLGDASFDSNPRYYARVGVTSGGAVGSYTTFSQKIEGVRTLAGKSAVLSFKCRADAPKKLGIEVEAQYGPGGSTGDQFAIGPLLDVGTAWARYVVPISIPSLAGKTVGSNDATAINFWLDSGANYSGRSSGVPYQTGWFEFAEVQLEIGTSATSIERRPPAIELAMCQRFCFAAALSPGGAFATGVQYSASNALAVFNSPALMRAQPTLTISGQGIGWTGDGTTNASNPTLAVGYNNQFALIFAISGASPGRAGYAAGKLGGTTMLVLDAEI